MGQLFGVDTIVVMTRLASIQRIMMLYGVTKIFRYLEQNWLKRIQIKGDRPLLAWQWDNL